MVITSCACCNTLIAVLPSRPTLNVYCWKDEAMHMIMMDKMVYWVTQDWTEVRLGQPPLDGQGDASSLAVPMMMLCLIDQIETMDPTLSTKYQTLAKWSLDQALMHIQVHV